MTDGIELKGETLNISGTNLGSTYGESTLKTK